MDTYLITARFDNRAGEGQIGSRIGIGSYADTFETGEDLFAKIEARLAQGHVACVFIDEAQFLSEDQVWQLARVVDDLRAPIMCYGLRVDFQGNLFPGSAIFSPLPTRCAKCARSATAGRRQRWSSDRMARATC